MAHTLIIGMTQSGKTSLARKLVQKHRKKGRLILVLDPLLDPAWKTAGATWVTDDKEKFLDVVFRSTECVIVIDEAGEMIGRYAGEMKKLATKSRHYGHDAIFITQRAVDVDKSLRDQCAEVYAFLVSRRDSEVLAEEFVNDDCFQASEVKQGEFIKCSRFKPVIRSKLF